MIILGLESSCDETAIAIVDDQKNILSHQIYSQIEEHKAFGGVVPEIAARSHIECCPKLLKKCLSEAKISLSQIDAVAVTAGPGLIGGVMVGVLFAKTIASILNKPFIAVNHLEGHALTVRLTDEIEFPYLLLLTSGGHCQFLVVQGVGEYEQLATTIDDAAGEVFDKVAKMLGLGYPGGPQVEKLAKEGDPFAFTLPKPLCDEAHHNLSFSGLKTATRLLIEKQKDLESQKANICASFQETIAQIFIYKLNQALKRVDINTVVISGGVAANSYLKTRLSQYLEQRGLNFIAPPMALCTDNAAMIAWAGIERFKLGLTSTLDFEPKSRWPLHSKI